MARPKVGAHRMMLTLEEETFQVLKAFGDASGKRPATMVREILTSSLPQIKSALTVIEHAKKGFISDAIFEGLNTLNYTQDELNKAQKGFLDLRSSETETKQRAKRKK